MFRVALGLFLATAAFANPLCVAGGSLASYEALGVSGCVVDPAIPLSVGGFSYSVLSSSGPAAVTPDSDIFVTPVLLGPGHVGIDFTSPTFDVSGSDFVNYQIGFTWDPPDIRSADDILSDPVVPPGLAEVNTTLCLDSAFSGTFCPLSTASVTVFDNGTSSMLTDSVSFASVSTLGVLDTLELIGGGTGGSAEIAGFTNAVSLAPEPAALWLCAAGLTMLTLRRSAWRSAFEAFQSAAGPLQPKRK